MLGNRLRFRVLVKNVFFIKQAFGIEYLRVSNVLEGNETLKMLIYDLEDLDGIRYTATIIKLTNIRCLTLTAHRTIIKIFLLVLSNFKVQEIASISIYRLRSQIGQQKLFKMSDYRLFPHPSSLDEEYQYVKELQAQKAPIELQSPQKSQDLSSDNDQEVLLKSIKIFDSQAFNEPQYKNQAVSSKTQRLDQLLPKIIKTYEKQQEQERIKRAKNESKKLQMQERALNLLVSASNSQNSTGLNISRTKRIKKEQYPTKNMLPSFKSSFLSYLQACFPKQVFEEFPIIKRIRQKFGINLQDYEDLFKEEAFRPHLKRYFRNKVIYRDLFQSRIQYKTKRIYFAKLKIFQEAFTTGVFRGIN